MASNKRGKMYRYWALEITVATGQFDGCLKQIVVEIEVYTCMQK